LERERDLSCETDWRDPIQPFCSLSVALAEPLFLLPELVLRLIPGTT